MKPTPVQHPPIEALQRSLQARGAAQWDPVGWHYLQVLAERGRTQPGTVQALLHNKLLQALQHFETRMDTAQRGLPSAEQHQAKPSPLADLLSDITQPTTPTQTGQPANWRADRPRIQQFRQQLGKIRVQQQVSRAIAQAPHNAGPINSHMLVLRSLGVMRDLSPDYLNRFMGYIDTLLWLDEATPKAPSKKAGHPKTAK